MFKRVEKGLSEDLLIIPGWGFDPYCFDLNKLSFNLILPQRPIISMDEKVIGKSLEKRRASSLFLLGWSLGAHLALDFFERLKKDIRGLILVSLIERFDQDMILKKIVEIETGNRDKALKGFYLYCFKGQEEDYRPFKKRHEKRCMDFWNREELIGGLNYLRKHSINPERIPLERTLIINGKKDVFSKAEKDGAPFVHLVEAGHLPFLKGEFYEIVNDFKRGN